MDWYESRERFERLASSLEGLRCLTETGGELVVRRPEGSDVILWKDHQLASLAELHLGLLVDPRAITDAQRADLLARATHEGRIVGPSEHTRAFFVEREAERVATFAIGPPLGGRAIHLDSLYVHPDARRGGLGRRVLELVARAARTHGLDGYQLETSYCWADTVRFYLRQRLWVRMWKRELQLTEESELPRYEVAFDGDTATFTWTSEGDAEASVIIATKHGERLGWREEGALAREPEGRFDEARWRADGTFALHLAMHGWPLLRSAAQWEAQLEQGYSDAGGPEGLAYKIQIWVAYAATRGWRSTSPRIPGLPMPTWAELEAEWDRREVEDGALDAIDADDDP